MARSCSCALRLLFLASLLLLCSAPPPPPPPPGRGSASPAELTAADEAVLARMCNPRAGPRPAWCEELHLIRRRALRGGARHRHGGHHRHHQQQGAPAVPLPPPGRDEVDMRYGVSKRRVPTGPNPLHN
ncbi:hypothetical protein CFC21_016614 [Triticum aestivum]|uniref:Uncharacterized protein n=2 Tax=Triticum aestivum TaxID=4565 RepID=A0A9R1DZ00_WHEAT|nr:uncharacterized protein LOC119309625 [Triticum dicoccoides]XP_044373586.1 uncharacterized protein LOC123096057 [Triticum aestivum]KAF7000799.1 hypothetical protein CFC21_016614 [Triticum aestivum]